MRNEMVIFYFIFYKCDESFRSMDKGYIVLLLFTITMSTGNNNSLDYALITIRIEAKSEKTR